MRSYVVLILLFCALSAAIFSIFGPDSYNKLVALKNALEEQKQENRELDSKVGELRSQVLGIVSSDRKLEKAARNELGMARPSEYIFIFDRKYPQPAAR